MRALLLAPLLALAACSTVPGTGVGGSAISSPAPLAHSTALRQTVVTTYQAYSVAIDAAELLIKRGVIKQGSATALYIAGLNDRINAALKAANAAIDSGSETDYSKAISDANQAFSQLQSAIHGGQ